MKGMAKIALLVGVSHCVSGFEPLPAAVRDVEALRSVLEDSERGGFDEVQVLTDPAFFVLRKAIGTLFANRAETDLLLFYFSGHGIADEYGRFYFTTAETQSGANGRTDLTTTLEASFIHEQMGRCDSERQVVILDCCHSGAFPEGMKARGAETIDFERQLGGAGRVVLASSSALDYSFEREGEDLAIYTRYLVEGIRTGAADLDEDGYVSVDELHEYVRKKVQKAAPSMQPERYVFRDGEKIKLAKAVVADPERQYRKLVEQYSEEGIISPMGRRILQRKQSALKLSEDLAQQIEAEVLKPYREYQESLDEYEEALKELLDERRVLVLKRENVLTPREERELEDLRKELQLRSEDVKQIHDRVLATQVLATQVAAIENTKTSADLPNKYLLPGLIGFQFETVQLDEQGKITERKTLEAEQIIEDLGEGITLEMVQIPGGTFLMGSPANEAEHSESEGPQHSVTVASFLLGKFQVTQAQWRQVAAMKKVTRDLNPDPSHFKGAKRPVEQVSWEEATEFCARLSRVTKRAYRLPSEAEWEYACRAGTTSPFAFGPTLSPAIANYNGNYTYGKGQKGDYREQTTDVGSFPANSFGLHDMHGNVWEWCEDWWYGNYDGAPNDGSARTIKGTENYRLLRGGSWYHDPRNCRSAYRYRNHPDYRYSRYGFRVACSLSLPRT